MYVEKYCAGYAVMKTFKSDADSIMVIIGNLLFQLYLRLLKVIITMQKSMFEIKCSDCGKTAMVPFKPTVGKPAYCKPCFSKHMFVRSESVTKTNGFDPKQVWARRRENGQGKKETDHPGIFQWSYSVHDKEAV
jgi:CxxC-x17-CxxC domain-containing protein